MAYSFRRPTQADLPAVVELVRVLWEDEGDDGDPTWFVGALFRMTDLERDWWLAEDEEGTLVAACCVRQRHPHRLRTLGGVVPEHRGRGLGTQLRDRIEERARELARDAPEGDEVWLSGHAGSTNESAQRLFEERGYDLVRHFWEMGIDLEEEPPEPEWPAGICLARSRPGIDERAVHAAGEDAFVDHWEHHPTPYEEWHQWHVESDDYDPSMWLLAWDGDEIAGISLCDIDGDVGWVGVLGVRRPWRRHGLATALLYESFRELRQRGMKRVKLGVDASNPTGATQLYESVGMRVLHEAAAYRMIL